jgi:bifunctional DNA-binding transcriptional regulator/antitoxin component of YhaV-PrlF toxin-antitoxin module
MTFELNLEKIRRPDSQHRLGLKPDDKLIIYLNEDCLPLARLSQKRLFRKALSTFAWNSTMT